MRPYCGESMHHAIMGAKEGRKAVGELWRDVFCRMVCPPSLRNAPRTLHLTKCFFHSNLSCYFSYWGAGQRQETKDRQMWRLNNVLLHRQECCDSFLRWQVVVKVYTVMWTHICGVPLCLWHGAHCGVRIKPERSSGMNWGENIFIFHVEVLRI